MTDSPEILSQALLRGMIVAPALVGDLPEGSAFSSRSFVMPAEPVSLNLQQKLGHLYEDVFAVMLESSADYDLLGRGIQVRKVTGHTLGELDFLVKNRSSGDVIHLELAVKFYLAIETGGAFLLPGPDARDNYFRKLEKMRSHQLLLVKNFRKLLPERFRDEAIVAQQMVHGCIFDHVGANKEVKAKFLSPQGRRGKWLHAKDCENYFGADSLIEIIPKPLWPVPLEILQGFQLEKWNPDKKVERCVMVRTNKSPLPHFIAPDGYPETERV